MIVIRLHGGLGNQMFQHALGLELASRGRRVVYDTTSYERDTLRSFELDVWATDVPRMLAAHRPLLPRRYGGEGWGSLLRGRSPFTHVRERPLGFRPEFLAPPEHSYLAGYWQSEKFFAGARQRVREAFRPASRVSAASAEVARRIERTDAIAVHVRRTDYLKYAFAQVCDAGYFERGVGMLAERHTGVEAFVFSDDLRWCEQNLTFPCPVHFVGHNAGPTAYEDLWLMTKCRRHVIPNSSFSWWGAWLKEDPTGEVIAPRPWFLDPKLANPDVLPERWVAAAAASPTRRTAA